MIAGFRISRKTRGAKPARKHADAAVVTEYAVVLASIAVTLLMTAGSLGVKVAEVFTTVSSAVP